MDTRLMRTTRPLTDPTGDTSLCVPTGTVLEVTETAEGLTASYEGWVFPVDGDEVVEEAEPGRNAPQRTNP